MPRSDSPLRAVETALRYQCPDGRRRTHTARGEDWQIGAGSPLPSRRLILPGGVTVTQRVVPRPNDAGSPDELFDLLENEVRIGVRLARRYPTSYPAELDRLVGYDTDGELPFVLFAQPRGEPLSTIGGELLPEAQQRFTCSILRGVLALQTAGVVHGRIDPRTVRFDGSTVQIWDYSGAALHGESRGPGGEPPYASPEQLAGRGSAHSGADLWSAGALIYLATTGRRPPPTGPVLDNHSAALRALLDGVFAAAPESRPEVAELLRRIPADATPPHAEPLCDAAFDRGTAVFASLAERKRASLATAAPLPAPAPAPPAPRRWWGGKRASDAKRRR
ncbi:hypothetical protein Val02_52210 [Virgisporangium aliadipatigenens]|uniref:Protein kinase domain-containing protein n=1 Tax=Virgisporangium aliadipatigenens TaxID=741659 RepID=A0A8J3YQY4_9ACTN|nr:hypothetical protein [Virgisporangium aliadipatigenens]GIJ48335.1 hypothetical protein Val02_52210 [Virgisporangium aliadipatigenens]